MSKIRKAVVYREVTNIINNGAIGSYYYLVEPERGKKQILEVIDNQVVRFVVPETVINDVIHYTANIDMGFAYDFTYAEAVNCVKYWVGITKPRPMPKYLGEIDEAGLCFQRLSFNYRDPIKPTLVIDEFMSRCTNSKALMLLIGSLTIENSARFQYGWIFGTGGEGKGSFARGLVNIFGTGCVTMAVPKTDSQKQFLAHSLQGKRLCVFPECSNFNFPKDPLFKQLTGGDHVWIEQKGKMGISAEINCRFLFLSNDRPGVEGSDANLRRMIYSEVSKPTVEYSPLVYDSLIKSEMPDFIKKCRAMYLEDCPNGEAIKFKDEKTKNLIDINEERFEVLTNKWFVIEADARTTPARMQEVCKLEGLTTFDYRQWVEYMRQKCSISSHVLKVDERKSKRFWVGLRDKNSVEIAAWVLDKGGNAEGNAALLGKKLK